MKLSVVIPTYNRSELLARTLDSVLAQTRPPDEVVVVDDGSTDDTRQVVAGYAARDGRVAYVYQDNAYLGAARNRGQAVSSGDLLCFLDSDDLLLPQALGELERALEAAPGAALAYCRTQIIDENGRAVTAWRPGNPEGADYQGEVWWHLLWSTFLCSSGCALVRRSMLDRVGPWDVSLPSVEDWDLWLRLAEVAPFVRVDAPLFQYRVHGSNMSADVAKMDPRMRALYKKHLCRHQNCPERLGPVRQAYRAYCERVPNYIVKQARKDVAQGKAGAALAKLDYVLRLHPAYLFDRKVMDLYLDLGSQTGANRLSARRVLGKALRLGARGYERVYWGANAWLKPIVSRLRPRADPGPTQDVSDRSSTKP